MIHNVDDHNAGRHITMMIDVCLPVHASKYKIRLQLGKVIELSSLSVAPLHIQIHHSIFKYIQANFVCAIEVIPVILRCDRNPV